MKSSIYTDLQFTYQNMLEWAINVLKHQTHANTRDHTASVTNNHRITFITPGVTGGHQSVSLKILIMIAITALRPGGWEGVRTLRLNTRLPLTNIVIKTDKWPGIKTLRATLHSVAAIY